VDTPLRGLHAKGGRGRRAQSLQLRVDQPLG